MDDIEAFLLASAATGIMTAKAKINMAVEGNSSVETEIFKHVYRRRWDYSAPSVLAGCRSRSGSDVSFSGRGCVLDEV